MKSWCFFLFLLAALLASGCASIHSDEHIFVDAGMKGKLVKKDSDSKTQTTGPVSDATGMGVQDGMLEKQLAQYHQGLAAMGELVDGAHGEQINSIMIASDRMSGTTADVEMREMYVFSQSEAKASPVSFKGDAFCTIFADSDFGKKFHEISKASLNAEQDRKPVTIDPSDVVSFMVETLPLLTKKDLQPEKNTQPSKLGTGQYQPVEILMLYLSEYFHGNYISHSGQVLKVPTVTTSIGNETIVGFITVVIDALYDIEGGNFLFQDARFKPDNKKEGWLTTTGKRPTSAKYFPERVIPVSETSEITLAEARALKNVAAFNGNLSEIVSGMVVRAFGDLEVSAVIGGHFSIGDNDTLAKAIDTIIRSISQHATEIRLTEWFSEVDGEDYIWVRVLLKEPKDNETSS